MTSDGSLILVRELDDRLGEISAKLTQMNPKELHFRIEGTVTSSTDDDYESLRRAMVRNQPAPDRK
jgi:hypothetical protein